MSDEKLCQDCIHFDECYLISVYSDLFPQSIVKYFNAIRQRDLCVNNSKQEFKACSQSKI